MSISCDNNTVVKNIEIDNYSLLDSVFESHSSNFDSVVPSIFVSNITSSLKNLTISDKKEIFIKCLLANVLRNNKNIILQRLTIIDIKERLNDNRIVTKEELQWLENISKSYRTKSMDFDALLKKVDVFPPSLIIAQAIVESGWGTSRFAIEGNSIFGEHFSNGAEGNYIQAGESEIKLRAFKTIIEAVESYSLNLNRHRAYRNLREMRFIARQNNEKLNSLELVKALGSYSEMGVEYIKYLKRIIDKNSLLLFDNLVLEKSKTEYYVFVKN
jgi:Bax protein